MFINRLTSNEREQQWSRKLTIVLNVFVQVFSHMRDNVLFLRWRKIVFLLNRFNSLIQAQAKELSLLREQLKKSRDTCRRLQTEMGRYIGACCKDRDSERREQIFCFAENLLLNSFGEKSKIKCFSCSN